MKITRRSIISGKENTIDLPITQEQYAGWKRGVLVQDAFPELKPWQREFILSGIPPEEWDAAFGESGDNDSEGKE